MTWRGNYVIIWGANSQPGPPVSAFSKPPLHLPEETEGQECLNTFLKCFLKFVSCFDPVQLRVTFVLLAISLQLGKAVLYGQHESVKTFFQEKVSISWEILLITMFLQLSLRKLRTD